MLGRSFLVASKATIDVGKGDMTMEVSGEVENFRRVEPELKVKEVPPNGSRPRMRGIQVRKRGIMKRRFMNQLIRASIGIASTEQTHRPTCSIIDAMKPFVDMFMASQGAEAIQWPDRLSDSSEDDEDEEETNVEGSDKGEAADDKVIEDDTATSYAYITDDVFNPRRLTIEGIVIREKITPIC
ncbi:hypothetical protein GOBAR_DD03910 [Gossypium barbadense]|nr:hypothetical protein GOBAR_DD03910 [Gossypium barbadense]